jgi:hypothetical protein
MKLAKDFILDNYESIAEELTKIVIPRTDSIKPKIKLKDGSYNYEGLVKVAALQLYLPGLDPIILELAKKFEPINNYVYPYPERILGTSVITQLLKVASYAKNIFVDVIYPKSVSKYTNLSNILLFPLSCKSLSVWEDQLVDHRLSLQANNTLTGVLELRNNSCFKQESVLILSF